MSDKNKIEPVEPWKTAPPSELINARNYVKGNVSVGNIAAGNVIINNTGANNENVNLLLEPLLSEIKALNSKAPATQTPIVEKMISRADGLITKSKSETPDREWYQLSLKGIKDAALTLKEMGEPILEIATKPSLLLLSI
jgi:hypothetical protein